MLPILLLGLGIGYFALTVPYSPPDIKSKLLELAKTIPLTPQAKARVNKMEVVMGTSSRTHNKRIIHLCLKKHDDTYYDQNTVVNAAIHELAHVICEEEGHTPSFREIESSLQREAKARGYLTNAELDSSYPCVL